MILLIVPACLIGTRSTNARDSTTKWSARYASELLTFWKKRRLVADVTSPSPSAAEAAAGVRTGPPEAAGTGDRGRCLERRDARGGLRPSPPQRQGGVARKDGGARGLEEAATGARRRSGEEEISLSMACGSVRGGGRGFDSRGSGVGTRERGEAHAMAARRPSRPSMSCLSASRFATPGPKK